MNKENINNDEIRQLSQREQARDKISVWYGSADNYQHGLKEVMANATDEIINNFDSGEIYVELEGDNKTITVRDTGRGVPINGKSGDTPNYELLFLQFFAGSKYGEDGITNGAMTGTNGAGLVTLNYTSLLFEVTSIYGGKKYHIKFENGGDITSPLSVTNTDEVHGSTFTFRLDPDVYTETEFTSEQVKEIIQKYAVSSPKVKIHYEHREEREIYYYSSVEEYFDELTGDTTTSSPRHASMAEFKESDGESTSIELIVSTATEPRQESFLNLTYLPEGGAINDGVINGLKLYMNKHSRDNNLFPKNVRSFSDSDVEESISFVAVVLSNRVEFSNQTKFSTQKKLYYEVAKQRTQQLLEVMEVEDRKNFDAIVKHLLLVQKDNASNQRQKEKLKKELTKKVDNLNNSIDKFVDSRVHGEEAELYLAEGDSAHGSVVLARDGKFQASLPMGGKFLNVAKANTLEAIVKNDIIMNVIRVLGCGVELGKKHKDVAPFDITKLRYGKIIIASDEDADGKQITSLVITLFHILMPEIIKQGKLFIAKTPLYEIKLKDDSVLYAYSDEERDKLIQDNKKNVVNVARSKGLGELDAEVMAETAMNPDTRHLVQVTIGDSGVAKRTLDDWMGTSVDNRKEMISTNLNEYIYEVIND